MGENEELKTILFNDSTDIDSIINMLKKLDYDSYGVIVDKSNNYLSPILFQGFTKISTKNVKTNEKQSYSLNADVWDSAKSYIDTSYFEHKSEIRLAPKKQFFDGSYHTVHNHYLSLIEGDTLFIGPKADVENIFQEEYANAKKRRDIIPTGEKL
ncbi:MAG: hypothetical protein KAS90_02130 [Candidatus Aenigmarchaeota archaeon]|nr:hypothetical protein [Candidatus Aenigmarchaeota archaeon]